MSSPARDPVQSGSGTGERPNLVDRFRDVVSRFGQRTALKADGGVGKSYTYAEIDCIIQRGIPRIRAVDQQVIALCGENCPEWAIAYLTIAAAGRTVVPLDPNLKSSELTALIRLSGARIVLTNEKLVRQFRALDPDLTVLSMEASSEQYWLAALPDRETATDLSDSDVAALIYTSGTTGDPKAVILTHRNLLANLEGIRSALRFSENDIFLSVLPLHHTFEATCGFLTPLLTGCTVVYARSLRSAEILEDIGVNCATVMCGVPLLYEKMHHSIRRGVQSASAVPRLVFWALFGLSWVAWRVRWKAGRPLFGSFRRRAGLGSIRMFVSGGAAMSASVSQFFNLVGFDFLQGYGMTECSPVVCVNRPDDNRFGSVGPPLDNVEVRIDHADADGIGEVCVRAESITRGYKNNPLRTAELIRDGWLHTGDLGRVRAGHLWITGRAKNVIVSAAGKNIYPEELEERLMESPDVIEAIVIGKAKPGGRQGEDVFAILVPDLEQLKVGRTPEDSQPSADEIRLRMSAVVGSVNAQIADYKRITSFEVSIVELEKTASKKIKRHLYRQGPK